MDRFLPSGHIIDWRRNNGLLDLCVMYNCWKKDQTAVDSVEGFELFTFCLRSWEGCLGKSTGQSRWSQVLSVLGESHSLKPPTPDCNSATSGK